MQKLILVTALLLASFPAAATEWLSINHDGRTVEVGCIPTPGTAGKMLASLTAGMTDVEIISDGSTDGTRIYATGSSIAEPIIHATGRDPATGEQAYISARKPFTGYVSNATVSAYLYDTDCPDGAGKQAQIVNDGPPMITGCWNESNGRILVEWQILIEPGRMVTLPRGEYIDVFEKPR